MSDDYEGELDEEPIEEAGAREEEPDEGPVEESDDEPVEE